MPVAENQLDFKGLAQELLSRSLDLLGSWFPQGQAKGNEFEIGDISGAKGDSLKINIRTGLWKDFAGDISGGDLISLFAAKNNIGQAEAYRILIGEQGYEPSERPEAPPEPAPEPETCLPPENVDEPNFIHPNHGESIAHWTYRDEEGRTIFHVARYEPEGKKHVLPWSWSDEKGWILKGFPAPRPLYGLEHKHLHAEKKLCLIVEGEKTAEAARQLLGSKYWVITWPNGAQAFKKADWSPVFGWCVLLWPDRDKAGKYAMDGIAELLKKHCPQIRMIDPGQEEDGWDADDFLYKENFDEAKTIAWAKERVKVIHDARPKPKTEIATTPITPELVAPKEPVNEEVVIDEFGTADELPTDYSASEEYWIDRLQYKKQKNQAPLMNVDNAMRALEGHPKFRGCIRYDTFYSNIFVKDKGEWRAWKNSDGKELLGYMQRFLGLVKIGKDQVEIAAHNVAIHNPCNAPKDWMETLKWDGVPRLDRMLTTYYTADENDYTKAVGKNFMIGMVARIYQPGCKQDNMMILEGAQGNFKTTSLEVLGGEWYSTASASPDNKDFFVNLRGCMLVEIKELDNFRKADATLIKKILDTPYDDFRPPYGTVTERFLRSSVFVGTTNEKEYLKDNTGARRFYPIMTHSVKLEEIKRDRDQLFAEAVVRYKAKETWWEVPVKECLEEQEDRRMMDMWEEVISEYLRHKSEVTTVQVCVEALKIEVSKADQFVQKRVSKIMHLLKWEKNRHLGDDGIRRYIWRNAKYYSEPDV